LDLLRWVDPDPKHGQFHTARSANFFAPCTCGPVPYGCRFLSSALAISVDNPTLSAALTLPRLRPFRETGQFMPAKALSFFKRRRGDFSDGPRPHARDLLILACAASHKSPIVLKPAAYFPSKREANPLWFVDRPLTLPPLAGFLAAFVIVNIEELLSILPPYHEVVCIPLCRAFAPPDPSVGLSCPALTPSVPTLKPLFFCLPVHFPCYIAAPFAPATFQSLHSPPPLVVDHAHFLFNTFPFGW